MRSNNSGMTTYGHLRITEIDEHDNEVVTLDEKNMIVDSGVSMLPRALNPKMTVNNRLGVIKFGKDVGTGTEVAPQQPTKTMPSNSQDVVFSVPIDKMHYTTTPTTITLSISMNGADIVGDRDFLKYTSAAIYTDNGTLFAYKRFPFRLFNRWVRVKIEWTISTVRDDGNGGGTVCPTPPMVNGVVLDVPNANVDVGGTVMIRGYEKLDDGTLVVVPNGSKWLSNNENISFSSGLNGNVVINGSQAGTSIIQLVSGTYADTRIIRIIEKVEFTELLISDNLTSSNIGIGGEVLFNAELNVNGVRTRVTQTATWVFSSNVQVVSTTASGVLVKILAAGRVNIGVTYLSHAAASNFDVMIPKVVESIVITPIGGIRFDVGETLDLKATAYYTTGESRLVTIEDRWVYNGLAISLKEIGMVGNLRITGKYRGDHDIRVYIDGVEGRLDFKIAAPITTVSAYGYPQEPIHVIPDVLNGASVRGVQSEVDEDDIVISDFYMTSSSPNMTLLNGVKVVGAGTHTITINKDAVVNKTIQVQSKYQTTQPLTVKLSVVGGTYSGGISIVIDTPTAAGVYIDHNDVVRRYYTTSQTVVIDYNEGDTLKFYGGCAKLTINGNVGSVVSWGQFACNWYNIKSETLKKVPYTAPTVTSMVNMFNGCILFNQNLSAWCVTSFATKPSGFDTGCASWTESKPIWGTCPSGAEIYKVNATTPSGTSVLVGQKIPLTITGINRLDVVVPFDSTKFTLTYDNSKIFVTNLTATTHEIEGLQRGITPLVITTANGTTTVSVEVK